MPQLMPFMWISSVLVGFFLLIMMVFMYNYIMKFYLNYNESVSKSVFMIKW